MCRMYGFRSSVPSGVHQSLVAAENALGRQSAWHPDGWGVAHYVGRYPQVIRSEKQALDDNIFKDVSAVVSTRTLLAHIRKATAGAVNVLNCHPFQHGPWAFAHNGEVIGFNKDASLRRAVRDLIDARYRAYVLGATDSELLFYAFLSRLARAVPDIYAEDVSVSAITDALAVMVGDVRAVADRDGAPPQRLTFMVTNGSAFVGYRHHRDLWFSTYKTECPERDTCPAYELSQCERQVTAGVVKHLIVTSEHIARGPNVWAGLRDGEYVAVSHTMRFERGRLFDDV